MTEENPVNNTSDPIGDNKDASDLDGFKSKWESKGYVGGLASTVAGALILIASIFGYSVSAEDSESITSGITAVLGLVTTISGIIATKGRENATKKIT